MSKWQRRSGIQLAYPFTEKRLLKNFTPPYIVQPKLNGERCRVLIVRGKVTLLSSEENEIVSVPHIKKAFEHYNFPNIEFDGELYFHNLPLQRIHSIVSRKKGLHVDYEKIGFHCFDLALEDTPQFGRLNLLYNSLAPILNAPIYVVESTPCGTLEEVEALLVEYMKECYEGIIIRDSRAPYLRKRTTAMLKWKPRKHDCYQIIGVMEEVSQYGEAKGRLGALLCMTDEDETFSVGTGPFLTAERRETLWRRHKELIGCYAVIKYPELTERGVPSHPVVIEISRTFVKDEDDADSLHN